MPIPSPAANTWASAYQGADSGSNYASVATAVAAMPNWASLSANYGQGQNTGAAIVNADSGWCYDSFRDRYYIIGGGHGDSAVNAIVAYDPKTQYFTRIFDTSLPCASQAVNPAWSVTSVNAGAFQLTVHDANSATDFVVTTTGRWVGCAVTIRGETHFVHVATKVDGATMTLTFLSTDWFGNTPVNGDIPAISYPEYAADGTPTSRHTYTAIQYIPPTVGLDSTHPTEAPDAVYIGGGSTWSGNGKYSTAAWLYYLSGTSANTWRRMKDMAAPAVGDVDGYGGASPGANADDSWTVFDEGTGHIFQLGGSLGLSEFDPVGNTWYSRDNGVSVSHLGTSMAIDPTRRLLIDVAVSSGYNATAPAGTLTYSGSPLQGQTITVTSSAGTFTGAVGQYVRFAGFGNGSLGITSVSGDGSQATGIVYEDFITYPSPVASGNWTLVPNIVGLWSVGAPGNTAKIQRTFPVISLTAGSIPIQFESSGASYPAVQYVPSIDRFVIWIANSNKTSTAAPTVWLLDATHAGTGGDPWILTAYTGTGSVPAFQARVGHFHYNELHDVCVCIVNGGSPNIAAGVQYFYGLPKPTPPALALSMPAGKWLALPTMTVAPDQGSQNFTGKFPAAGYCPAVKKLLFGGGDHWDLVNEQTALAGHSYRQDLLSFSIASPPAVNGTGFDTSKFSAPFTSSFKLEQGYAGPVGYTQLTYPLTGLFAWDPRRQRMIYIPSVQGSGTPTIADVTVTGNLTYPSSPNPAYGATGVQFTSTQADFSANNCIVVGDGVAFINSVSGAGTIATCTILRTFNLGSGGGLAPGAWRQVNNQSLRQGQTPTIANQGFSSYLRLNPWRNPLVTMGATNPGGVPLSSMQFDYVPGATYALNNTAGGGSYMYDPLGNATYPNGVIYYITDDGGYTPIDMGTGVKGTYVSWSGGQSVPAALNYPASVWRGTGIAGKRVGWFTSHGLWPLPNGSFFSSHGGLYAFDFDSNVLTRVADLPATVGPVHAPAVDTGSSGTNWSSDFYNDGGGPFPLGSWHTYNGGGTSFSVPDLCYYVGDRYNTNIGIVWESGGAKIGYPTFKPSDFNSYPDVAFFMKGQVGTVTAVDVTLPKQKWTVSGITSINADSTYNGDIIQWISGALATSNTGGAVNPYISEVFEYGQAHDFAANVLTVWHPTSAAPAIGDQFQVWTRWLWADVNGGSFSGQVWDATSGMGTGSITITTATATPAGTGNILVRTRPWTATPDRTVAIAEYNFLRHGYCFWDSASKVVLVYFYPYQFFVYTPNQTDPTQPGGTWGTLTTQAVDHTGAPIANIKASGNWVNFDEDRNILTVFGQDRTQKYTPDDAGFFANYQNSTQYTFFFQYGASGPTAPSTTVLPVDDIILPWSVWPQQTAVPVYG